ncbi:hypothetical protein RRF57_003461 [Xylaria bambusicola]|uniref:HTH CENPB-type domain-containing protein n=1 Tax=Xylaria bambusicola TaxID=326684 RepID=A0AAN7ULU9_9PEZI
MYHVPDKTLRRRINGVAPKRGSRPKLQKLTKSEENAIVSFIIDLDSRAFPPQVCYVKDMANRLAAERGANPVGKCWTTRFINRTLALRTRLNRRIDYSQVLCEDPDEYNAYFKRIKSAIEQESIAKKDIYNFNETGFMIGMITTNMVVTSVKRRNRPRQSQQGNRNWSTAVCAINSQGWSVPPFIILERKTHLASWYRNSPLPYN